jgi:hypothetical protein
MTVKSPFASGQLEVTPPWSSYLDLENDVKPWLQDNTINEAAQNAKLEMVIDDVCVWIQSYLGRPIAPTTFTRRFSGWSGWNGAVIALPYYPVLATPKVVEWWGTSGPHELIEQTPEVQGGGEMFQLVPLTGQIVRSFQGLVQRPFFPGLRNIEVQWEAGYNPVPPDIKMATLRQIAHEWRKEQQASRSAPAPAGAEPEYGGPMMGLHPDVKARISPYLQQSIG